MAPTIASLLVAASAAIVLVLGALHLLYTFRGSKLDPREAGLRQAMERSSLRITHETTVWRAWVGFNATHSLGLMLFALIYAYLALAAPDLLFGSRYLQGLGLVLMASYIVLARRYFFSVPFRAIVLATLLYIAGFVVASV